MTTTDIRKFRVHLVNDNHVDDTVYVEATSFEDAEAKAGEAEKHLVEPIIPCAGCGRNMQQMDPRGARRMDGTPVHDDPWNAYQGIRCIGCAR